MHQNAPLSEGISRQSCSQLLRTENEEGAIGLSHSNQWKKATPTGENTVPSHVPGIDDLIVTLASHVIKPDRRAVMSPGT